jgi:hypothetical protein
MPGYRYRGTIRDAHLPWPPLEKRRRPGRKRAEIRLQPCGTVAAYRRHLAKGEPIDTPCQLVSTESGRQYRKARKEKANT